MHESPAAAATGTQVTKPLVKGGALLRVSGFKVANNPFPICDRPANFGTFFMGTTFFLKKTVFRKWLRHLICKQIYELTKSLLNLRNFISIRAAHTDQDEYFRLQVN